MVSSEGHREITLQELPFEFNQTHSESPAVGGWEAGGIPRSLVMAGSAKQTPPRPEFHSLRSGACLKAGHA